MDEIVFGTAEKFEFQNWEKKQIISFFLEKLDDQEYAPFIITNWLSIKRASTRTKFPVETLIEEMKPLVAWLNVCEKLDISTRLAFSKKFWTIEIRIHGS